VEINLPDEITPQLDNLAARAADIRGYL